MSSMCVAVCSPFLPTSEFDLILWPLPVSHRLLFSYICHYTLPGIGNRCPLSSFNFQAHTRHSVLEFNTWRTIQSILCFLEQRWFSFKAPSNDQSSTLIYMHVLSSITFEPNLQGKTQSPASLLEFPLLLVVPCSLPLRLWEFIARSARH